MDTGSWLPRLQEPATCPCHEPDQSSPCHPSPNLMFLFNCLGCTKGPVQTRGQYTRFVTRPILWWGVVNTSHNLHAGGPPLIGCTRLLIQYIRSYPPYWRPSLHPQPEDAPYRDERDPLPTTGPLFFLTNIIISTAIPPKNALERRRKPLIWCLPLLRHYKCITIPIHREHKKAFLNAFHAIGSHETIRLIVLLDSSLVCMGTFIYSWK
jgi:hypothetical protein